MNNEWFERCLGFDRVHGQRYLVVEGIKTVDILFLG